MEFTLFLSDWTLFCSWDLISAVSDNIGLPNWGNSITCGLKVTHFWIATQSVQYPFPQAFCFWDQAGLYWSMHIFWIAVFLKPTSPVSPVSISFTCVASAVTVFPVEATHVGFEHYLLAPSPASTSLWFLRFLWIPLDHMENFCLLYHTAQQPWRNGKLLQALL